jgi:tol-pal system protein YbgF
MKRAAAFLLIACAAACRSSHSDDELPATIPPAEIHTVTAPDTRIAELQASMTELLDRLDVLNARIAKLEASGGQPPPPVQPSPQPQSQPAPAGQPRAAVLHQELKNASIADEYRRAITLVGQSKPVEARAEFQKVFDADPSGDLADNALFWIGETYFATGGYSDAMRFYERVAKEYPDANKAPDAVYKLGMAFEKTGDLGMARRAFDEVIAKYPYSTSAASARAELKKIKY